MLTTIEHTKMSVKTLFFLFQCHKGYQYNSVKIRLVDSMKLELKLHVVAVGVVVVVDGLILYS